MKIPSGKRVKKSQPLLEALRDLLQEGTVGSQEEIRETLAKQGFIVNQSKISRTLHKIGAVKTINEKGQVVYHLPIETTPPAAMAPLASLVIQITHNEYAIVVQTNPGCAQLIARMLDHHRRKLAILGTVAGDDTIFVMPVSIKNLQETLQNIKIILNRHIAE